MFMINNSTTMNKTRSVQFITLELADLLASKAMEKADELKMPICVWIVDPSGSPVLFKRQDGAPQISTDTARRKAMTAIGFGFPTGQAWYDFIQDDPILSGGVPQMKEFILLGGGSPVRLDGAMIGAIGVSGGHYRQDEECVSHALSYLE